MTAAQDPQDAKRWVLETTNVEALAEQFAKLAIPRLLGTDWEVRHGQHPHEPVLLVRVRSLFAVPLQRHGNDLQFEHLCRMADTLCAFVVGDDNCEVFADFCGNEMVEDWMRVLDRLQLNVGAV